MEKNKETDNNINPENQEMVKGIISEEALDTIAAGLDWDSSKLTKILIGANVAIIAGFVGGNLALSHVSHKYDRDFESMQKQEVDETYKKDFEKGFKDGFAAAAAAKSKT